MWCAPELAKPFRGGFLTSPAQHGRGEGEGRRNTHFVHPPPHLRVVALKMLCAFVKQ
jgi:hypothetical protein